jgi:hypothetical protein
VKLRRVVVDAAVKVVCAVRVTRAPIAFLKSRSASGAVGVPETPDGTRSHSILTVDVARPV